MNTSNTFPPAARARKRNGLVNRRSFVAGAGMLAFCGQAAWAQDGVNPGTPAPEVEGSHEQVGSHLIVGDSSGSLLDTMYSIVEIYGPDLEPVGSVEIPDGVLTVEPTGNPNIALVNTMGWTAILRMETGSLIDIESEDQDSSIGADQWFVVATPGDGRPWNPDWMVASNVELTNVMTINTQSLTGRDITPFVNQNQQEIVPVLPRYFANSSLSGLWTGDNVYLVDLQNPENARRLVGNEPDWYSTTMDLDPSGTWCTYTIYDPTTDDAAGRVILGDVATGDFGPIVEGTAWSQAQFIPGDAEHFLLIANGEVRLRAVSDPEAEGDLLAEIGEQTHHEQVWDSSGQHFLLGTRDSDEAPTRWQRIDLSGRVVEELADLEGLQPMMVTSANPNIDHVLFGLRQEAEAGPVPGFSFATGETSEYLESVYLGEAWEYSSSGDGRWYFVRTANRGDTRGAWLFDLEQGHMHELPWGEGEYTLAGAISGSGDRMAITVVARPSDETTTYVIDLQNPDQREPVSNGHVLGWS